MREHEESAERSGWTFHDLGIEDAAVRQIKSDLAIEILKACQAMQLSMAEIAERYGISASELSRIRNASYDRFTIDRLVRMHATLRPEARHVLAVCHDLQEADALRAWLDGAERRAAAQVQEPGRRLAGMRARA